MDHLGITLIFLISQIDVIYSDDLHYDRKVAILNGGLKRYRCVEEWVPVDAFGNILHEGIKEIQSTTAHLDVDGDQPNTASPSLLIEYIRTQVEHFEHGDAPVTKLPIDHSIGAEMRGVKTHDLSENVELGLWERELLETLEEEVMMTTQAPPHSTTRLPTHVVLSDEMRPTTQTPRSIRNSTGKPRQRGLFRPIKTDPIGSETAYLGSTGPPLAPTTTTFLFLKDKNRMQMGGMSSNEKTEEIEGKEKSSRDLEDDSEIGMDEEGKEVRRQESSLDKASHSSSPIRPQRRHRPHHEEDLEDIDGEDLESQDFEESADDESDFHPSQRFFRGMRYRRPIRPGPYHRRRNGYRRPRPFRDYEDFYEEYEETPRRRQPSRRRYPHQNPSEFPRPSPFNQFGGRRRSRFNPNKSHLSTLPLNQADPRGRVPLPVSPETLPRNMPLYQPPSQFPIQSPVFPLPMLAPTRVTPNPMMPILRRGERVRPSPRPQVTSLPIQPIPMSSGARRVTPGPRQQQPPPRPSTGNIPDLEEASPENCNKMKQLAESWGIKDVLSFAKSNCSFLQAFAPKFTCEQITQFVASCYRAKFFN